MKIRKMLYIRIQMDYLYNTTIQNERNKSYYYKLII